MLHSGIAFSMNDTCDADKKKEEKAGCVISSLEYRQPVL